MNKQPLTIVIFGATGNLYADKLARALFLLFQNDSILPTDFRIIAFARKDFTTDAFRSLSREYITKKGDVDIKRVESFVSHIEYYKGNFLDESDFERFKTTFSFGGDELVVFHIATASFSYEKIFENMQNTKFGELGGVARIMIEKPFGKNEQDAEHLESMLTNIFTPENIFHIDHYLAKETAQAMFSSRFLDDSSEQIWRDEHISKIKIIFHESNIVGSRGASYDKVGAFRDVGENHMLELLALVLMDKPDSINADLIKNSRAEALEHLFITDTPHIVKGQYEGYVSEAGVDQNSKTETFFRVFLKSKDPRFSDTNFELEGGKGLVDIGSEITTTMVTLFVYFKNGEVKTFNIQPVPGTSYNSYVKVYTDVVKGDSTLFVSKREIIAQLKLAEDLLEAWKDVPLVIYKKGTAPEHIK